MILHSSIQPNQEHNLAVADAVLEMGIMTKEEADAAVASSGIQVMEDAGRGYRRVVASPKPAEIIEIDTKIS